MDKLLSEITIEVTQKCGSSCIFCSSNSSLSGNSEVSFEKIIEIVDFCKQNGAQSINLSGGEPLLHHRIFDIVDFINENALKAVIYTSGNVQSEIWNNFLTPKRKNNLLKFIFNYPSYRNETYCKLINSKAFNINSLNEAIQNLIRNNFEVEVHIVPNKINFHTLYDSSAYLKTIGIKRVSFLRLVAQGRAEHNKERLLLDNKILIKEISKIKSELEDKDFSVRAGIPFGIVEKRQCKCKAGLGKLIFRYDGIVFPCEAFKEAHKNNDYILGSIYENELYDIWKNYKVHFNLKKLKEKAVDISEPCPAQLLFKRY